MCDLRMSIANQLADVHASFNCFCLGLAKYQSVKCELRFPPPPVSRYEKPLNKMSHTPSNDLADA